MSNLPQGEDVVSTQFIRVLVCLHIFNIIRFNVKLAKSKRLPASFDFFGERVDMINGDKRRRGIALGDIYDIIIHCCKATRHSNVGIPLQASSDGSAEAAGFNSYLT